MDKEKLQSKLNKIIDENQQINQRLNALNEQRSQLINKAVENNGAIAQLKELIDEIED